MSILEKLLDKALEFGKFVLLGEKQKPVLEEPLDELKTERAAQRIEDRRRERAAKKNSGKS